MEIGDSYTSRVRCEGFSETKYTGTVIAIYPRFFMVEFDINGYKIRESFFKPTEEIQKEVNAEYEKSGDKVPTWVFPKRRGTRVSKKNPPKST